MTTARQIITGALTFHLNRLSPGETLDADLADVCLQALNHVVDEFNGVKRVLFREVLTTGAVTTTGTLGTTWAGVAPGDEILGVTRNDGSGDKPVAELTIAQYQDEFATKTTTGSPEYWAHDGLSTVYFFPRPVAMSVTLRTRAPFATFADLDTDYSMPAGYLSAFSVLVAARLVPTTNPQLTAEVSRKAAFAGVRLASQAAEPAILNTNERKVLPFGGWQ
jgi:hypothetical protein